MIDILITDTETTDEILAPFRATGIEVIQA
jgi:hypothetical protein